MPKPEGCRAEKRGAPRSLLGLTEGQTLSVAAVNPRGVKAVAQHFGGRCPSAVETAKEKRTLYRRRCRRKRSRGHPAAAEAAGIFN